MALRLPVLGAIAIAIVVGGFGIFVLVALDRQLESHQDAASDNRTWNLTQIEVDLQRLQIAMLQARLPQINQAAIDLIRRDFDILYSRVDLVRQGRSMVDLPMLQTEGWRRLNDPRGLMATMTAILDRNPEQLPAQLERLSVMVASVLPLIRHSVTETLQAVAKANDSTRHDLRFALQVFSAVLLATIGALALFLLTIHQQSRALAARARKLEHALRSQRVMIEASQDGILLIASNDKILVANKVTERLLGLPAASGRRRLITDHLRPEVAGLASCTRRQTFIRRTDGQETPVELTMRGTVSPEGRCFRVAFLRDMTDQIERETRLAQALNAAQQGEEAKARFVAVMSHEMRTPLSGLLSALDLLQTTTQLDSDQRWLVDIMGGCGRTTLEQINNVLELTHLAAPEKGTYQEVDFDLRSLLQAQVQQFQGGAMQRGTALALDVGPGSRMRLRAPLQLVKRVLNNLLSNAVKFTEGGGVEVTCTTAPAETPGQMACRISVKDSGIGISALDLDRIFHTFETLDSSFSRTQDGSGLGLGIAKLAAEALGGRIEVESTLGKGSRFTLHFQAKLAEAGSEPKAPAAPQHPQGLRILLAEDNAVNRLLLVRQLEHLGHEVIAVANGADAIEEVQLDEPFDLVLMDISMPRMDGVTATRILRRDSDGRHLPIVALTAHVDQQRLAEFRAAGMDDVISKPVDMARLMELTGRILRQTPKGQAPVLRLDQAPGAEHAVLNLQTFDDLIQSLGPVFLQDTLARYDAEIKIALPALQAAQQAGDGERLAQLAHREAGSSAMLGFAVLAAALRQIETEARAQGAASLAPQVQALDALHVAGMAEITRRLAV